MKLFIFLGLSVFSAAAFALPEGSFDALTTPMPETSDLLDNQAQYNFEGIVKLSNCSGSLIILNGQPMTSKALIMTNGHCIQKPGGYLNPGEVWVNRPIQRDMKVYDSSMKLHPISATKIAYATMTDTDMAFYELKQSYQDILDSTGVHPLTLDAQRPLQGLELELISGYWDRGWSCSIDSFIYKLKESTWTWTDSIRYTQGCDTMGGTSGSPLISKADRHVIGINNTSNRDGGICTSNNPCEVSSDGRVSASKGLRYGQQTYKVYTCLTPDFRFNLALQGCELPR